jgi:hypothetical protein
VSHWRLCDPAATRWRRWDDEIVVYHGPLAATLLLEGDTATVFQLLAEEAGHPIPESELMLRLLGSEPPSEDSRAAAALADGTAADGDDFRLVRDILDSLRTSGLAECRAS